MKKPMVKERFDAKIILLSIDLLASLIILINIIINREIIISVKNKRFFNIILYTHQ